MEERGRVGAVLQCFSFIYYHVLMYYCMKSYVCLIYLIHLECMIAYSTWNVIILENILCIKNTYDHMKNTPRCNESLIFATAQLIVGLRA